jgi:hypothetical protein
MLYLLLGGSLIHQKIFLLRKKIFFFGLVAPVDA